MHQTPEIFELGRAESLSRRGRTRHRHDRVTGIDLIRRCLFVAAGMLLSLTLTPSTSSAEDSAEVVVGDVLVGVDELGRVLIAVDEQPLDGRADHCFLFTAGDRLAGPWSERLTNAKVVVKAGSLSIRSTPPFFVASLALTGREPLSPQHPPHADVFSSHDGMELSRMDAGPAGGALLDSMDVTDLHTWPESFWYDLLAPESGPCPDDSDCDAGGKSSNECSLQIGQVSCSVTCLQDSYPCCKETSIGGVSCRCRPCIMGP